MTEHDALWNTSENYHKNRVDAGGRRTGEIMLAHRTPGVPKGLVSAVKADLMEQGYSHVEAVKVLRGTVVSAKEYGYDDLY